MNRIYKIGILIVALIGGYFIGNFLPFELLKPSVSEELLSKGEYSRLIVSVISAIITFLAVIVALFKDDFREMWKCPRINFDVPSEDTIEETNVSLDSESSTENIKARKYISRIEVNNKGNLPAINAEIYLDKLEFIPKDSTIAQSIEASSSALKWNGSELLSIIIPPGGKKLINVAEITAPIKISTPESTKTSKPSNLIIGTVVNNKEQEKGIWNAKFSLYAQNHKPISFEVKIEWNGLWKNRLTEFKNQYQINMEGLK